MSGDRPVAVVAGGSRGIGAATCALLAARGWDVVVGYARDAAAAADVVRSCEAGGGRAVAVAGDVADAAEVGRLFDVAAGLGEVRAAVVSAGVVAPVARVDEMGAERIRRLLEVNVLGTLLVCGEAVRRMSTRHGGAGGSIVTVSSAASRIGSPAQYVDYAATKGAVDALTLGLAKEVAAEGVRVNAVRPGIIDTEIHASGGQPDKARASGPSIPLGRAGRAEEVAAAIAWLVSDEASYATGSILDVAGGR